VAVKFWTYILEGLGSNLGQGTGYPDRVIAFLSIARLE
jgi:hypothetical protein